MKPNSKEVYDSCDSRSPSDSVTMSFPHKWFRLAIVFGIFAVSFQFAIDNAASRTLCCSYRAFRIVSHAMDRMPFVWKSTLLLLFILALASMYIAVRAVVAVVKKRQKSQSFVVDLLFALGVPIAFHLEWTAAMGHAEVWWAKGFREGLVAVTLLWAVTLIATWRQSPRCKLRVLVFFVGAILMTVVPAMLVYAHPEGFMIGGEVHFEEHAASTNYGFCVLIACVFWAVDVLISSSPQPPSII